MHSLSGLFSVEAPATEPEAHDALRLRALRGWRTELRGRRVRFTGMKLSKEAQIRQMLAAGKRYRDLHLRFGPVLRSNAWGVDTSAARRSIAEMGGTLVANAAWLAQGAEVARFHLRRGAHRTRIATRPAGWNGGIGAVLLRAIAGAGEDVAGLFAPFVERDGFRLGSSPTAGRLGHRRAEGHPARSIGEEMVWIRRELPSTAAAASSRIGEFDSANQAYQAAVRQWADRLELDESRLPGRSGFSTALPCPDARVVRAGRPGSTNCTPWSHSTRSRRNAKRSGWEDLAAVAASGSCCRHSWFRSWSESAS